MQAVLRQAIAELPPKSGQAIEFVYMQGLKSSKAAVLAGCGVHAFRDRLDYALASLRAKVLRGRRPSSQ